MYRNFMDIKPEVEKALDEGTPVPISMDFEKHFISSLSSVSSFRFSSDTLILLDNSHIEAFKLIPR